VYIIDGNNVIGGRVGWHRDKAGSRRVLLQDLARLARTKKLRLNVVFDGAPDPQFPDGTTYHGVRIFYSRPGSDADTRIIEMVEAERNKKSLVVVTSDGKLTSRVRACGARVMRSGEFRRMLDEAGRKSPDQEPDTPDVKPNVDQNVNKRVDSDEMNEWLRYFGVEESDSG
jgi:predicted RNA-binding protein with PIN domain